MIRHSFSAWSLYRHCPRAWRYQYLDKVQTPRGPEGRGTHMHACIESYLKKEHDYVQPGMANVKRLLDEIRSGPRYEVEHMVYVDRCWKPSDRDNRYCTGIFDCVVHKDNEVHVLDWKTGGPQFGNRDQMSLYTTLAFALYPVDQVTTTLVYIDKHGHQETTTEYRILQNARQEDWQARFQAVENDSLHEPNPGGWCRRCRFHKKPCPGKETPSAS